MYKRMHLMEHQAVGNSFISRRLSAVVAAAIIGLVGLRGAIAAEPTTLPVKPIGAAGVAAPQAPKPLGGVMRLNPSKFGARSAASPPLITGIQASCSAVDPNHYAQLLRTIQNKENLCATASYSVEDQRTAGCSGADTVDQCQTKLYNNCMDRGGDRAAFKNAADQELAVVRRARDMLDGHMRYIENTRPLHSGEAGIGHTAPQLPHFEGPIPIH